MMYLSHLLIDTGCNPDRPRPGRLWLRNIYHVHQRLCMAFPSPAKVADDFEFLKPFCPSDFQKPKMLFRIERETVGAGSCSILVLSEHAPDWNYAFRNASMMLAGPCQSRVYEPKCISGQRTRFRILANPSKRSSAGDSDGKRVSLTWSKEQKPEDVIIPWFAKKGNAAGFSVDECHLVTLGWTMGYRPKDEKALRFRAALLEGTLRVADPDAFLRALTAGIGPAKAFGFGLLSVAPA